MPLRDLAGHVFGRVCNRASKRLKGVRIVSGSRVILDRYDVATLFGGYITIRLHHIQNGDPIPNLYHDHPWSWSMGWILSGEYLESMPNAWGEAFQKLFRPLMFNPMLHDTLHHLTALPKGSAWTLYVHGPREVHDGFMLQDGPSWHFMKLTDESDLERTVVLRHGEPYKHEPYKAQSVMDLYELYQRHEFNPAAYTWEVVETADTEGGIRRNRCTLIRLFDEHGSIPERTLWREFRFGPDKAPFCIALARQFGVEPKTVKFND